MKKSEEQLQKAENDASESDKKLLQAQKRIVLLESGEYGLTEAIKEIKGCDTINFFSVLFTFYKFSISMM